jgi:hypothetical protein
MKWQGRKESENVEDRRGMAMKAGAAVGGGSILLLLLFLLFGMDPQKARQLAGVNPGGPAVQQGPPAKADPEEEKQASFTKVIFRDTEDVWDEQFRRLGKRYEKPVLVLFTGRVESACGLANSAVGPFYCPGDSKVYIDLDFYQDMQKKLGAPGEFARAYVVAHEVGHHVQRLLGYSDRVDDARRRLSKVEANRMSVRLELQADFLAGVWAHHAQRKFNFLEAGDVETALNAANAIGDDRLQKQGQGYIVPDAFTHGTSQQRMRWFMEGLKTGDVNRAALLFDLRYEEL